MTVCNVKKVCISPQRIITNLAVPLSSAELYSFFLAHCFGIVTHSWNVLIQSHCCFQRVFADVFSEKALKTYKNLQTCTATSKQTESATNWLMLKLRSLIFHQELVDSKQYLWCSLCAGCVNRQLFGDKFAITT